MRRHTITTAGDQYATRIRSIRIERDVMQLQPRAVTNVTRRDSDSIRFGLPLSSGKRDTMPLPPQVTLNSTRCTSFMQQTWSNSTQLTSFKWWMRWDTTQLTFFEWWTRRDANTTSSSGKHDATTISSNPALVNNPTKLLLLMVSLCSLLLHLPAFKVSSSLQASIISSRRPFEQVWTNAQDTIISSIDCEMMQH